MNWRGEFARSAAEFTNVIVPLAPAAVVRWLQRSHKRMPSFFRLQPLALQVIWSAVGRRRQLDIGAAHLAPQHGEEIRHAVHPALIEDTPNSPPFAVEFTHA